MVIASHPVCIKFYKIHCLHETTESGADEVYFKYQIDSGSWQTRYEGSPIKMNTSDYRAVDIDITTTVGHTIHMKLEEKDSGPNHDDHLGEFTLDRYCDYEGSVVVKQTTGDARSVYEMFYRVIEDPVPAIRLHGMKCLKQSSNCDDDLLGAIQDAGVLICDVGSEIAGNSKNPKAELVALGFDICGAIIDNIGPLIQWILKLAEGADDVYLQHILSENEGSGGAFYPINEHATHMEKDDQHVFADDPAMKSKEAEYCRFPLDRGSITIQLRERDPGPLADIPMGHITVDDALYNKYKDQGVQFMLASEYFEHQRQHGQGALYLLCYSVGVEDFTKNANSHAQSN